MREREQTYSASEYVRGQENIPEIPKPQRFMNRPDLRTLIGEDVLRDKLRRNVKIVEAVQEHGYTQRDVADYLEMHFASVCRILRQKEKC